MQASSFGLGGAAHGLKIACLAAMFVMFGRFSCSPPKAALLSNDQGGKAIGGWKDAPPFLK